MAKRKHEEVSDEDRRPRYPDSPEPVRREPFTYGGLMEDFLAKGRRRGYPSMWRTSLFPTVDTPTARRLREKMLSKHYIIAQFEHFGISYDPKMTKDELRSLMQTSLNEGKFDSVAPSVVAIEESMREEFERRKATHKVAIADYQGQMAKRRATKYSRAKTLPEKAEIDSQLFINDYFLDDGGAPDRTKVPQMIRLDDVSQSDLAPKAGQVPGLHASCHFWDKKDGKWGRYGTVFIGWDADEVKAAGAELVAFAKAQQAKEKADKEQQRLDEHLRYLTNANATAKRHRSKPPMYGRYMVRCPTLENGWDIEDSLFVVFRPLAIFKSHRWSPEWPLVFEAVFDFGIIKGSMLLCENRKTLDMFLGLRMGLPSLTEKVSGRGKDGDDPRRRKASGGKSARLYHFFWAGFDSGEGEVVSEFEKGEFGKIMFADDFTTFGGEMDVVVEEGLSFFGGGKISDSVDCDDEEVRCHFEDSVGFEVNLEEVGLGLEPLSEDEIEDEFDSDASGLDLGDDLEDDDLEEDDLEDDEEDFGDSSEYDFEDHFEAHLGGGFIDDFDSGSDHA